MHTSEKSIDWIEDPSNQHSNFDRNRIRQEVMPKLLSIRSGAKKNMFRTVDHLQNTRIVLEELLGRYLKECLLEKDSEKHSNRLSKLRLLNNSNYIIANLLRQWLKKEGFSMPPTSRLNEFIRQLRNNSKSKKIMLNVKNVCGDYSILVQKDEIVLLVD